MLFRSERMEVVTWRQMGRLFTDKHWLRRRRRRDAVRRCHAGKFGASICAGGPCRHGRSATQGADVEHLSLTWPCSRTSREFLNLWCSSKKNLAVTCLYYLGLWAPILAFLATSQSKLMTRSAIMQSSGI